MSRTTANNQPAFIRREPKYLDDCLAKYADDNQHDYKNQFEQLASKSIAEQTGLEELQSGTKSILGPSISAAVQLSNESGANLFFNNLLDEMKKAKVDMKDVLSIFTNFFNNIQTNPTQAIKQASKAIVNKIKTPADLVNMTVVVNNAKQKLQSQGELTDDNKTLVKEFIKILILRANELAADSQSELQELNARTKTIQEIINVAKQDLKQVSKEITQKGPALAGTTDLNDLIIIRNELKDDIANHINMRKKLNARKKKLRGEIWFSDVFVNNINDNKEDLYEIIPPKFNFLVERLLDVLGQIKNIDPREIIKFIGGVYKEFMITNQDKPDFLSNLDENVDEDIDEELIFKRLVTTINNKYNINLSADDIINGNLNPPEDLIDDDTTESEQEADLSQFGDFPEIISSDSNNDEEFKFFESDDSSSTGNGYFIGKGFTFQSDLNLRPIQSAELKNMVGLGLHGGLISLKKIEPLIIDELTGKIKPDCELKANPNAGKRVITPWPNNYQYKIDNRDFFGICKVDTSRLKGYELLDVKVVDNWNYKDFKVKPDLVMLMTEEFDPNMNYSQESVDIFRDLVYLADRKPITTHPKFKLIHDLPIEEEVEEVVVSEPIMADKSETNQIFTDVDSMVEKMQLLIGSISSGNSSDLIKNELSEILDNLLKLKAITDDEHKIIFKKYINLV